MAADQQVTVDTVPAAVDNAQMRSHWMCGICTPMPVRMGDVAVCGEKVLGVPPQAGAETCEKCIKVKPLHISRHRFGGRG